MTWLEHRAKYVAPPHAKEQSDHRSGEFLAILNQHATEVVFLEVFPHPLDVVELFGGVRRQPADSNAVLDSVDLRDASLRFVSGTVVEDQHDPSSGTARSGFQHLEHSDEQARVDAFRAVREHKGSIGPAVRPAD